MQIWRVQEVKEIQVKQRVKKNSNNLQAQSVLNQHLLPIGDMLVRNNKHINPTLGTISCTKKLVRKLGHPMIQSSALRPKPCIILQRRRLRTVNEINVGNKFVRMGGRGNASISSATTRDLNVIIGMVGVGFGHIRHTIPMQNGHGGDITTHPPPIPIGHLPSGLIHQRTKKPSQKVENRKR